MPIHPHAASCSGGDLEGASIHPPESAEVLFGTMDRIAASAMAPWLYVSWYPAEVGSVPTSLGSPGPVGSRRGDRLHADCRASEVCRSEESMLD